MHKYPVVKTNLVIRLPKSGNSIPRVAKVPQPVRPKMAVKAVSQKHSNGLKKQKSSPGVKYITRDSSPVSHGRLMALKDKYRNRFLVIVANGPSITEVDLPALQQHAMIDFMSINKPDPRLWPTTHWLFCDTSQFRRHKDLWDYYNGYIFNSTAITQQKTTSMQVKNLSGKGFSKDLTKGMHIGRSSVYAAMQVALWLGYKKIFLFGVDMCAVNGKLHFYGINPDVDPSRRKGKFGSETEYYDYAADNLGSDASRFYFCSGYNKWPFVTKYNNVDHKQAIQLISSMIGESDGR